jgi:hypothetical protein
VSAARDELLRFAEDPMAHVVVGPDEQRMLDPRFVVTFSPGNHVWSTSVCRLRVGAGPVAATVEEVRALGAARGRRSAVWLVGDSATPGDLAEQLVAPGIEMHREVTSDVLVLTEPPHADPNPSFDVATVARLEDHRAAIEVAVAGFGFSSGDAEDERARAEATFRSEQSGGQGGRLLARAGGRPVATGRAWRSPWGLYLGGGATLPDDRGRGAMTALVVAAWGEAVRLGTPALVTHGGEMSTPILARLGFERVGRVVHFMDVPSDADGGADPAGSSQPK